MGRVSTAHAPPKPRARLPGKAAGAAVPSRGGGSARVVPRHGASPRLVRRDRRAALGPTANTPARARCCRSERAHRAPRVDDVKAHRVADVAALIDGPRDAARRRAHVVEVREWHGPVDEQQVDVIEPQLRERVVQRGRNVLGFHVGRPELGRHEKFGARRDDARRPGAHRVPSAIIKYYNLRDVVVAADCRPL